MAELQPQSHSLLTSVRYSSKHNQQSGRLSVLTGIFQCERNAVRYMVGPRLRPTVKPGEAWGRTGACGLAPLVFSLFACLFVCLFVFQSLSGFYQASRKATGVQKQLITRNTIP